MLRLLHPPTFTEERRYIHRVLLRSFLGVEYREEVHERPEVVITLDGDRRGRRLVLADVLFQTASDEWLRPGSLPSQPLPLADVAEVADMGLGPGRSSKAVPVLFGAPREGRPWIEGTDDGIRSAIDLFGGCFFLLTRYEEIVRTGRDRYGRFPAEESLAFQEGFLLRPIVNEYLEILWSCLVRLWPNLQRLPRRYAAALSHDVDYPLMVADRPLKTVLKNAAGDVAKRKDPTLAVRRCLSAPLVRRGRFDADVGNTFGFIMDVSERHGLRSAFYFIGGHSGGAIDGTASVEDPWIGQLLGRIHARGHEIGIHPSYNTYRDPLQTRREFERLRRVCAAAGIDQPAWGGRQHFLRWENPTTWQNWEDAGLDYDSTLTFPEQTGFRGGVCYPYPVFNLTSRRELKLVERPLLIMEATLLGDIPESRMRLGVRETLEHVAHLSEVCRSFDGECSLLWHNSSLISRRYRTTYAEIVALLAP